MRRNEPVSKIMTHAPLSVQRGEAVSRVRRLFGEAGLHHVPVLDGKRLVGMVSATDLAARIWGAADPRAADVLLDHTTRLDDIMTKNPVSVDVHQTVREAAKALAAGAFHAIPVTNQGELVGIVTTTDLIRYLLEQY